jgi:hypothetical protein
MLRACAKKSLISLRNRANLADADKPIVPAQKFLSVKNKTNQRRQKSSHGIIDRAQLAVQLFLP